MKRIPWWTIAAIAAVLWFLVGSFGRFRAEGAAVPAANATNADAGPWTQYQPEAPSTQFDPSTARPVAQYSEPLSSEQPGSATPSIENWAVDDRALTPSPYGEQGRSENVQVQLAPDGAYVVGTPHLAPDGTYVSGAIRLAPDGTYVGGEPRLAPDGTYVVGRPTLAPDGTYVGGDPILAPDGTYLGDGSEN